jgi:hypothetical protein
VSSQVSVTVQPPAVAWAILVPGFVIHTTFGVLSGYVTHSIVKATSKGAEHTDPTSTSKGAHAPSLENAENRAK